jgi:hypothetical protein
MSYTIVSPATIPVGKDESQITLDTGQSVGLGVHVTRMPGGGSAVLAAARQLEPDGTTTLDANGHPITSACSHAFDATTVAGQTLPACAKDCALLALGEPPVLFGASLPALDPSVIASYSIRNAIASAAHAGAVSNLGALLK